MSINKILSAVALAAAAVAANAAVVKPGDAAVAVSPPFGMASEIVTTQYSAFGLVFSQTAVFSDPPLAWGGVNADGVVDLVSPINAYFVLPSTTSNAVTDFLSVEIGYANVGALTLEAFDIHGNLLGSTLNDDGLGPNGRTLATLSLSGIHSFRVSGADTWGMNQVEFGNLTAAVPEPETYALMLAGLAAVGAFARRRQQQR